MAGLALDTGALVALERRDRHMQAIIKTAVETQVIPTVPAQVIAQYWRDGSGRQAVVAKFLHGCNVEPLNIIRAKQAGMLLRDSCTDDETDAVVALIAHECGAVVTSDPGDIR